MKKSSKRLVISTDAKNRHGFRVRTAGIDLAEFTANPLLLWMHKRPKGESQDEILPLGYWEDVELNDGKLSGIPVFDDKDAFAMKIHDKVEANVIRMASAGLRPREFKKDQEDLWLWDSSLFEVSLCDIGSNPEALAVSLYDANGEEVTLSDVLPPNLNPKTKDSNMRTLVLSASTLNLLKLKDGATEAEALQAIQDMSTTLADKEQEVLNLTQKNKDLAQEVLDLKKESAEDKAVALAEKAVAEKRITADQKDHYVKLANADYETTDALLKSMPVQEDVASKIDGKEDGSDELLKLSYDELDKSNKLTLLKEKNIEAFKEKFKKKFGTEYQG